MKCKYCDGTGEYVPFDADVELDKLYSTEQTNEEWFCGLSTEEKAEFLSYDTAIINDLTSTKRRKQAWVEWLKEIHKWRFYFHS